MYKRWTGVKAMEARAGHILFFAPREVHIAGQPNRPTLPLSSLPKTIGTPDDPLRISTERSGVLRIAPDKTGVAGA